MSSIALEDVTCKPGQFRCEYPRCISSVNRCDGENNCGDWSDEEGCGKLWEDFSWTLEGAY